MIMKSATIGTEKIKGREGTSSPRKKELLGIPHKIKYRGHLRKARYPSHQVKNLFSVFDVRVGVHGWCECRTPENFNWRELMGAGVLSTPGKSWLHSYTNPKSKSMIYKILKQNNLYHNPDLLFRLIREVNESIVMVEGQEARALLDSGSQLSAISLEWVKKLKLKPQQLQSILQIEGSEGLEVPYLGYVEACLKIPEIKAFDLEALLLIVPDSAYTQYTPITIGTLHIDMAIKLATKKSWKLK